MGDRFYARFVSIRLLSSIFSDLFIVFSRVWTLWAVMNISPTVYESFFFTLACTSWALVEVPRYLFYALNLLGQVPYPVFWLRYSLFAILYPTGISGELGCMYMAVLFLKTDKITSLAQLSALPTNDLILLSLIVLVILTYVPGTTFFLFFFCHSLTVIRFP